MQGPLILDRYRPIEVKGEGGSGKVEICWDTRIQRRVAIKRMPISSEWANGSIPGLAEARTGAMLSRPSIVSVYDFDTVDNEAFLIMEAIEGPSLAQIIDDTPPATFDLDIAAAIVLAVGDAIEFAHENQVLHLDIKPDNILVNRNGACKVSDFGVSELADAQGFRKASGGTIGYMPPEQMNGHELDERTDEFALAAVTYEILTGKRPFAARSLDASAKLIQKFDIAPASSLRTDLDPGIDSVLFTALSPDPDDRYDSVEEFLAALMPYLGNPARGSRRLREIVQVDDEVVEEESYVPPKRSILDHISPRLNLVLGRVIAAALCWWLSTSALFNVTMLDTNVAMLVALLPARRGRSRQTALRCTARHARQRRVPFPVLRSHAGARHCRNSGSCGLGHPLWSRGRGRHELRAHHLAARPRGVRPVGPHDRRLLPATRACTGSCRHPGHPHAHRGQEHGTGIAVRQHHEHTDLDYDMCLDCLRSAHVAAMLT